MKQKSVSNLFFEAAADALRSGNAVKLRVEGNSMVPSIRGGKDLIELIPYQGEDLPLWCAVFYRWEGRYMTHRLVRKDADTYAMLGDGNMCRIEVLPRQEIIGVLKTIIHPDGSTTDCLSADWLRRGERWNRRLPYRKYYLRLFRVMRMLGLNPVIFF